MRGLPRPILELFLIFLLASGNPAGFSWIDFIANNTILILILPLLIANMH